MSIRYRTGWRLLQGLELRGYAGWLVVPIATLAAVLVGEVLNKGTAQLTAF